MNYIVNPYAIIPVFGLSLYGFLFYKIYTLRSRSSANIWFLIYLAISLAAGFMDFMGSISATSVDALFWYTLFFVLNAYSFSALTGFLFAFTERKNLSESSLVRFAIFIPPTIVSALLLFTDLVISHESAMTFMVNMMWRFSEGPLWGPVYFGWIQIVVFSSIILFLIYSKKVQDHNRKIQARLYAMSLFAQVVVDVIFLSLFPVVLRIFVVPDGIISVLLMGSILAYGILRYNLFSVNSAAIASNIVDTMGDMVIAINREGNVEYINKAVTRITGYTPHALVGRNIKELLGGNSDAFQNNIIKLINSDAKEASIRTDFISDKNIKIPVQISASPVMDQGRLGGIVCVVNDLTQLLKLQDVTLQRDILNKTIESFKDAIMVYDKKFNVHICNSAGAKFLGKQASDLIGKSVFDLINLESHEGKLDTASLIKSLGSSGEDTIEKRDMEIGGGSDIKTAVNLTITSIDDTGLDLAGLIILEDISREKQLEDMKLDFVSIAAHELRTPITSIRGYMSLLLESDYQKKNSEEFAMIKRVGLSAEKLYALIDNLLSVSKIERGRVTVHLKAVDWMQIVDQAVAELTNQAAEKKIDIKVQKSEAGLPQVSADPLLVNEVVANLISNAIAYTPVGGKVKISFESDSNSLITHITDTGEGISPEAQEHLFTKFYRVAKPLEQGSKGTGLGLFISKSIVDMHSGKIWVVSDKGKGATFSFSLPLNKPKN